MSSPLIWARPMGILAGAQAPLSTILEPLFRGSLFADWSLGPSSGQPPESPPSTSAPVNTPSPSTASGVQQAVGIHALLQGGALSRVHSWGTWAQVADAILLMAGGTYKPNNRRRKKRLGFLARMATRGGRKVLGRKRAKGRWILTP